MDGSGVILRDEAVVDNSVARQGNDDPDLLVASENTGSSGQDYRDVKQNERGIRVVIDRRQDELLTALRNSTLTDP